MLTSAHFVDWGLARPAAMGPHGQLDSRTQAILVGFFFVVTVYVYSADNGC